ncbi:MAG: hypothetical protein COX39_00760 [Candidatus Nealsonbacteria bacterium CG23_combo_of_CG06-09_8_20_14_all_40_13]|uniref:Uncharacterized protein n=1 Tax=Candidatus Nealsonbacteria bacterium CG23_combo_of_CG06-09_8_20_14_all_40_13 TaxID=1974724 RepID=A0A2G9YRM6_9BACT|nr:MAG: hypothetical protein COX39_00760 [Candidatus Nealsonbacteria bacterium CG23_combo_of_CG06-09_8_20_14_all_40_13]PIR70954.1 MAG: hypothetical protein COU44_02225 [Candidatus Nealsonbacteria bacterium CG10_big_fil_rev_8_21_14_0_10_40_24]PIU43286.1 MAG: hypothetical protein COS97_01805 [Candidatus Nealsonbacteria bacterium CG07_land_8_20_14_0_80_40_10]
MKKEISIDQAFHVARMIAEAVLQSDIPAAALQCVIISRPSELCVGTINLIRDLVPADLLTVFPVQPGTQKSS